MAISVIDNISLKAKKLIDERMSFESFAQMSAYDKNSLAKGLISYCEQENKFYYFNGESWTELGTDEILAIKEQIKAINTDLDDMLDLINTSGAGGIDESKFVLKAELDEFNADEFQALVLQKAQEIADTATAQMSAKTNEALAKVDEAVALLNATIAEFKATYPRREDLDEFNADEFKAEILAELGGGGAGGAITAGVSEERVKELIAELAGTGGGIEGELVEFDVDAFKKDLQAIFDNATQKAEHDLVTMGQVEEFDLQAYHLQLQADTAELKKDLVTTGDVEEFDPVAFKEDIRSML